ncbi:lipase [Coprinellus micaceus]|uniref:Lipase n=1 Tax=Coprinellus micaceus TaxID=71717 RepID=A0A4Y7SJF4_COPMI|nr:lipase [Coprinellus micaceus]
MLVFSLLLFAQFAAIAFAAPAAIPPVLEARQSVTTLSASQVAAYKPYTHYANAAYCPPAKTLAWDCGTRCSSNPTFVPIASGGDGGDTQYWYVGWDPSLKTLVVGYQGTDSSKILPIITNINFGLQSLRTDLFPGLSSDLKTHDGFGDAHARSAAAVLAAVRSGISKYAATKVTLTGHSLGGAIAIVATAHLAVNLPTSIGLRTITYGSPRVGNQAFADYVNARAEMNRIDNQDDPVPILPGRFLGFSHTEGEVHIVNSGAWKNCPGQDNTDAECTIGYVPNVLSGDAGDHGGPYDGVSLGGGC